VKVNDITIVLTSLQNNWCKQQQIAILLQVAQMHRFFCYYCYGISKMCQWR